MGYLWGRLLSLGSKLGDFLDHSMGVSWGVNTDVDFEAAHFLALEFLEGFFGVAFVLVLNEGVGYLWGGVRWKGGLAPRRGFQEEDVPYDLLHTCQTCRTRQSSRSSSRS